MSLLTAPVLARALAPVRARRDARASRRVAVTRASSAEQNAADAQRWIDAWKSKKSGASANAADAQRWIDNWRAGKVGKSANASSTVSALDAMLPKESKKADEPPAVKAPRERKPGEISPEMKKRLMGESVGLGGLPDQPMPSNIFLNVILGVSAIVLIAYLGGIRP